MNNAVSLVSSPSGSGNLPATVTNLESLVRALDSMALGEISGTGVVGQVAEFVTNTKTLQAAKIIGPATNILTLTNSAAATLALAITAGKTLTLTAENNYNLTIPATGTAALLGVANVFTAENTFNGLIYANASGAKLSIGGLPGQEATYSGFWLSQVSPSNSNYMLLGSATDTYINAPSGGTLNLRVNNTNAATISATSWTVEASNAFILRNAMTLQWKDSGGTARNLLVLWSDNNIYFDNAAGGNIVIRGATTQRMLITQAGLVTVGSVGGSSKLSVAGETDIRQFQVTGHTTQAIGTTLTQITRNDAAAGISAMLGFTALGSGAAGDGGYFSFAGKSSTTAAQAMGLIDYRWITATHASRAAALRFYAYDTAARLCFEIEASGTLPKLAFYGGTTVVRGAALTTQLTAITHTAPGTPDYAIQDFTQTTPWGFADHDEANSVLKVIANLQTRVAELEARLGSVTGVNLFA